MPTPIRVATATMPWTASHPARAYRRRHLQVVGLATWVMTTLSITAFLLLIVYMSHHPMPSAPASSPSALGHVAPRQACILGIGLDGRTCSMPPS
jgi:hypothetical protein